MSHSSSGNPRETNADCTRCRRTTTTSALVAVLTVPVDSKGLTDPREAKTCGALCDPCLTAVLTNIERTSP